MDAVTRFLEDARKQLKLDGRFRGLLHILIGRRVTTAEGVVVSAGLTWRETAALLKRVRWDKDAVREVGLNPADLPPRDRERYWYTAVLNAQVDSPDARQQADELALNLRPLGYEVGPAPGGST
jgi:hypothetical protein